MRRCLALVLLAMLLSGCMPVDFESVPARQEHAPRFQIVLQGRENNTRYQFVQDTTTGDCYLVWDDGLNSQTMARASDEACAA